jgi:hypothetical protein
MIGKTVSHYEILETIQCQMTLFQGDVVFER